MAAVLEGMEDATRAGLQANGVVPPERLTLCCLPLALYSHGAVADAVSAVGALAAEAEAEAEAEGNGDGEGAGAAKAWPAALAFDPGTVSAFGIHKLVLAPSKACADELAAFAQRLRAALARPGAGGKGGGLGPCPSPHVSLCKITYPQNAKKEKAKVRVRARVHVHPRRGRRWGRERENSRGQEGERARSRRREGGRAKG